MNKFIRNRAFLSLFVLALSFTSCQDEFEELTPTEETTVISATSEAAILISNIATRDGSFDNIVDGASCFDVKFPYVVSVNGLELTINALEDLHVIEEIFDAIDDDENLLEIIFPITITTKDFTEVTLNGLADLRELANQCKEGGDDEDIECIDLMYPITLFTVDINVEQTGSFIAESDKDLRLFFGGLEADDLVSIDFPISFKLYDGAIVEVNSNVELVRTIEGAKDTCDEDDDDDYNDDDFNENSFNEELVECVWVVKEFRRNNAEEIGLFLDYILNFKSDGTVVASFMGAVTTEGTWSTTFGDDGAKLSIAFESIEDFNFEWSVYDIGDDRIKLYKSDEELIVMKKACEEDLPELYPEALGEILRECSWVIKEVKLQDEELKRLLGYEFMFMTDNVITLSNGMNTFVGTWEIKLNAEQKLVVAIEMPEEPGVSFEWPIREMFVDRLRFEADEIGYELKLQRVCDNNTADGDVTEIRNIMLGGEWIVTAYTKADQNMTEMFGGYSFGFMGDNQMTIMEGGEAFGNGLWRVLRNSDEQLKVYLNFGENLFFEQLSDNWDFVSVGDNGIELKEIEDDGTITTLVLKKV